jgi:hypothetical protein
MARYIFDEETSVGDGWGGGLHLGLFRIIYDPKKPEEKGLGDETGFAIYYRDENGGRHPVRAIARIDSLDDVETLIKDARAKGWGKRRFQWISPQVGTKEI